MLNEFLLRAPKVDLHLHLVGSASPATVAALAERSPQFGVPTDPQLIARFFEFVDFPHFIDVYTSVVALVRTAEDIADLVAGAAVDLAPQNVPYAELTVSPHGHVLAGMAYDDIVDGITVGLERAKGLGVELAIVFDTPGEYGVTGAEATLGYIERRPPPGLTGFGLAGAEADVDRALFADVFDRARALGLHSVPHAGEGDGPASIWSALGYLRAERIGHGVRAVEDPRLVAHLVDHQIPLEICPSSNVCTKVFADLRSHSIGELLHAGAFVTINTDDPPMFATTLTDEYLRVADAFSLDIAQIAKIICNGIDASFLPTLRKLDLIVEVSCALSEATAATPVPKESMR
jgi:aminodeoxyfutalosine deaminase